MLPTGIVTFVFTDIEGSTRLVQRLGDSYVSLLDQHWELLHSSFEKHGGIEFDRVGDSVHVAFRSASDAVTGALEAQRALSTHPWPADGVIRVRMGIHTGEAGLSGAYYTGLCLHEAARISAAAYGGQILVSQTTRDLAAASVPSEVSFRDLGEHRLKDLLDPVRLFQLVHPDLPPAFPPPRSLDVTPNNLPLQLTQFIGREREISTIKSLLAETRLLTLTGAGGCGKTRLALQVAGDLLYEMPGGAWFVDLAALTDPSLLAQEVAAALGVPEAPGETLEETLVDSLCTRRLLLILDNCEHLVAACADLAHRLLRACPYLQVIATTREPLGVPGETTWRVPSMELPPAGRDLTLEELLHYEAARLFVERAHDLDPAFSPRQEDVEPIVQICTRLDGIPLAIELAAARVPALTPAQIASRLDDRFRLLTGGSRTALERQQTLRALVDWSYELLTDHERILLRRLSVFAGGFTLEAAEAVCADDGIEQMQVLDLLSNLVAKSLVVMDREHGARYRMLETIRQYAREKLLGSGEGPARRTRHREWYLALAERAKPALSGPRQRVWLDRLETEHENLRAALEWSVAEEDPEAELRLVGALWRFWEIRGHWVEGRACLEAALSREDDSAARLRALLGAGTLAGYQGDLAIGRSRIEEALAMARELGDRRLTARALHSLGMITDRLDDATRLYEESLAISREIGDREGAALTLMHLGSIARADDDYARARQLYEESLAIWRDLGDERRMTALLSALGSLASLEGDHATARAHAAEAIGMARRIGNKPGLAQSLNELGQFELSNGDIASARRLFEESLSIARELGARGATAAAFMGVGAVAIWERDYEVAHDLLEKSLSMSTELEYMGATISPLWFLAELARAEGDLPRAESLHRRGLKLRWEEGQRAGLARALEPLGGLLAGRGEHAAAARLLGAADALRTRLGTPLPPLLRDRHQTDMAAVKEGLSEEEFEAAWSQGQQTPIEEIVSEALGERAGQPALAGA